MEKAQRLRQRVGKFQPTKMGHFRPTLTDGEIGVSGGEVSAEVTVGIDLIKERCMRWPIVSREEGLYIVVSLPLIDEALHEATREAVLLLQDRRGITFAEAAMLASLAVDIRVSQLVDPYKTVKAFVPHEVADGGPFLI